MGSYASAEFDMVDILRKIVRECTGNNENLANHDVNDKVEMLGENLDRNMLLLVLNDAWNVNTNV